MNNQRTLTQIKWFAIFLAVFFTVSAGFQYFFVKNQVDHTVLTELSEQAKQISNATGLSIEEYNKSLFSSNNYLVILNDGYLFDNGNVPREFLSKVQFTGDEKTLYEKPISYTSPLGEHWRLFAKRLIHGRVILGVSEYDALSDSDTVLQSNAALFNGSVTEAVAKVPVSKLDNPVAYDVIDDSGALLAGYGRLPLRITDPLVLGSIKSGPETLKARPYLLQIQPFNNGPAAAGEAIVFQDVSLEHRSLKANLWFNVIIAGISWLLLFIFGFRYWNKKESEKREIRERFQNYFSPQVMDVILRDTEKLKLGGERREVTVLFSDIRSFTSMTENLPPQVLTRLLNEYFSEMTEAVFATDGVVDKYIGDAIMAFWGAPTDQDDQADRAVRTALDMMQRLKKLSEKWEKEVHQKLDIGIGIDLGVATVGKFGSSKRFDYTIIGDVVNVASRIEGLNKNYKSNILISEATKRRLTLEPKTEDLGEVQVKGKGKLIRIFRVFDNE